MRHTITFVAVLWLAAACATESQFASRLDAWKGRPIGELVKSWRAPQAVAPGPDGGRIYTWEWSDTTRNAGAFLQDGQRIQPTATVRRCTTQATVSHDGIIRSWSWTGNGCKAKPPAWLF